MKNLSEGNIYKNFILFAIPMIFSGLLSQAYHIVDTVIAGKFLGETGLAVIGATTGLITLVQSLFWGYGVGFSIYIARLFGAEKWVKIKQCIFNNILFSLIAAAVIGFALVIFHKPVFRLLNVSENLYQPAFEYFSIYLGGMFMLVINWYGVYIMNAFGSSTVPLMFSLISCAFNIFGNIFSVTVLKMGVKGIALATVISGFVTSVCYIIKLLSCFKAAGVENVPFKFSFEEIKKSLPYSFPSMFQQGIMCLSAAAIAPV